MEKAEKLETSRVSKPGSRVVNKSIPSNTNSTSTAAATQNSKTLKSVWRLRVGEFGFFVWGQILVLIY